MKYALYKIGSNYFFNGIINYVSKDIDYVAFDQNNDKILTQNYKVVERVNANENCKLRYIVEDVFTLNTMDKRILMDEVRNNRNKIILSCFFIPEFNEIIGFTFDDLKSLEQDIMEVFTENVRYGYYKTIYEYYKENNGFTLTEEQRQNVFAEYLSRRKGYYRMLIGNKRFILKPKNNIS